MKKDIKRAKIINYSVAISLLIIYVIIASLFCIWKWEHTFTDIKWKNNPEDRYKIVNNMLSKNKIIGMTKNEIIELLGKETVFAPETFKYPKGNFSGESHLIYGLGVDFMHYEWLIITVENGVAVSYAIGIT